jgi:hypothetical protein
MLSSKDQTVTLADGEQLVKEQPKLSEEELKSTNYMFHLFMMWTYAGAMALFAVFMFTLNRAYYQLSLSDREMPVDGLFVMIVLCGIRVIYHGGVIARRIKRGKTGYFYSNDNGLYDKHKYWVFGFTFPTEAVMLLGIIDNNPDVNVTWLTIIFSIGMVICMNFADLMSKNNTIPIKNPEAGKMVITILTVAAIVMHTALWATLIGVVHANYSQFRDNDQAVNFILTWTLMIVTSVNGYITFIFPMIARWHYVRDEVIPTPLNPMKMACCPDKNSAGDETKLEQLRSTHITMQTTETVISFAISAFLFFMIIAFRNNDDYYPKKYYND